MAGFYPPIAMAKAESYIRGGSGATALPRTSRVLWPGVNRNFTITFFQSLEKSLPHLAIAPDDVFIRCQFLKRHRTAGVELIGTDPDFRAHAKLAPIGEAG